MQFYTWPRSRNAVHTRSLQTQVVLHRTAKDVDLVWQHENTFDVLPVLLHSSPFPPHPNGKFTLQQNDWLLYFF